MKYLRGFGRFWYHFIVGDDWKIAASVVFGLGLISVIVHVTRADVWWLLPAIVLVMLGASLWHETRLKK
jgi:hypothetical protein